MTGEVGKLWKESKDKGNLINNTKNIMKKRIMESHIFHLVIFPWDDNQTGVKILTTGKRKFLPRLQILTIVIIIWKLQQFTPLNTYKLGPYKFSLLACRNKSVCCPSYNYWCFSTDLLKGTSQSPSTSKNIVNNRENHRNQRKNI